MADALGNSDQCTKYLSGVSLPLVFKGWFSKLRDINLHTSIASVDLFCFITITVVITIRTFWFSLAMVFVHYSFHHFFENTAQKSFESILEFLCEVFFSLTIIKRPLLFLFYHRRSYKSLTATNIHRRCNYQYILHQLFLLTQNLKHSLLIWRLNFVVGVILPFCVENHL